MFVFECQTHGQHSLVLFLGQYTEKSKAKFIGSIQEAYQKNLTPESLLLIYPAYLEEKINELIGDESVWIDLTRQKSTPLGCFTFGANGDLSRIELPSSEVPKFREVDVSQLGEDVVNSGFANLMDSRCNDVLVQAPSGTTFVKPSGNDLEEFIYASQLARTSSEHQFLAMSLLRHSPNIDDIDEVYIDTSSISAIAEAVIYYITKFSSDPCKHVHYRSYSSYDGLENNVRPDNLNGTWVIISASASTSMGINIVKEWGINPCHVVTILSYKRCLSSDEQNIGNAVVYCLDHYSQRDKKSFSPTKVQVQGESFSVEASTPNTLEIIKPHKPSYIDRSIFQYYNENVFSVNRNGRTIYVSYTELRKKYLDENGDFAPEDSRQGENELYDWMMQIVEWKLPKTFSAILCETDPDSEALLQDFKNVLSGCSVNLNEIEIIGFDEQDRLEGLGSGSVVVLSPAVSTGHTFVDVNRALRLANHLGMRVFVSPVVVAPSQRQFKTVHTSLTRGTGGFDYSYHVFRKIFFGSKNLSPWDKELEVVTEIVNRNGDNEAVEYWVSRKEQLERRGDGLGEYIGLHYENTSSAFELVPDFVFWPRGYDPGEVRLAAVFATVGAILQNLRDNNLNGKTLQSNVYQHSVIDPENFVRFNDSVLQSCLWRCSLPGELDFRRSEKLSSDMRRILTKIMQSAGSPRGVTSLDLLMAIATRWMKLSSTETRKVIDLADAHLNEPHAKLMIEWMRHEFNRTIIG